MGAALFLSIAILICGLTSKGQVAIVHAESSPPRSSSLFAGLRDGIRSFTRGFQSRSKSESKQKNPSKHSFPSSSVTIPSELLDAYIQQLPPQHLLQRQAAAAAHQTQQRQEFLFLLADRVLNVALFLFTFRLVTRTLSAAWSQAVQEITNNDHRSSSPWQKPGHNHTSLFHANTTLNSYELDILSSSLILPSAVESQLEDIGGLGEVKTALLQAVITPRGHLSSIAHHHNLYRSVKSILLFGPPGCGKSMLARALCHKMNVPMLSIAPSSLLRMYVGETSRLTKSVFTLARKMNSCILFIDEMDSLFRSRDNVDHAVERNVKTEFMQLWDELIRDGSDVIIVGATNRPQDLDAAIQRRFERSFLVPLPDHEARVDIFTKILQNVNLADDFDFTKCADWTEGYSPSGITDICRAAVMIPVHEAIEQQQQQQQQRDSGEDPIESISSIQSSLRALENEDIEEAMRSVFPVSMTAQAYQDSMYPPYSSQSYSAAISKLAKLDRDSNANIAESDESMEGEKRGDDEDDEFFYDDEEDNEDGDHEQDDDDDYD